MKSGEEAGAKNSELLPDVEQIGREALFAIRIQLDKAEEAKRAAESKGDEDS